jgi:hypothetical protein
MRTALWQSRFRWLLRLGIGSLIGLLILLACMFLKGIPPVGIVIIGALLFLPGAVYLMLVTMWHWKERYRGEHSDLWGGLILFETSGWFKLVYLVRHIIPDARGTGRYTASTEPSDRESEQTY